jgi:hypothetical protein
MKEKTPHQTTPNEGLCSSPTTVPALPHSAAHVNALGTALYILAALMLSLQVARFILWLKVRRAA